MSTLVVAEHDNSELKPVTLVILAVVAIEDGKARITREVDGGLQTITTSLPVVITTDLRLNEPRYASRPHRQQSSSPPQQPVCLYRHQWH